MSNNRTSLATKTDSGSTTLAILTFTVADQIYGLPVTQIVRIIEMVTITQLPGAPAIIQGVINVQGKTVPVMDLRHRFGLPMQPYGLHTPIVLADTGDGQTVGLIVDSVEDVIHVPWANLATPETILPAEIEQHISTQAAHLAGVITKEQHMLIVLNAKALLTSTEQVILYQVLDSDETLTPNAPQ